MFDRLFYELITPFTAKITLALRAKKKLIFFYLFKLGSMKIGTLI